MAEQSGEGHLIPAELDSPTRYANLDHPYELVDTHHCRAVLRAQNGTEFEVTRTVGRTLLALGVGVEHEKTRQEVSTDLYPDSPGRLISQTYLKHLVRDARIATIGLGPSIIAERRGRDNDTTYYYESILPEQCPDGFEGWDNDTLTRVRFDTRTSYLTISGNDARQEARINGRINQTILEAFLRHPNKDLSWYSLSEAILDMGHDRIVLSKNIESFRRAMERRFGDNFSPLFTSYLKDENSEQKGWRIYSFAAGFIEIIEKDGSKRVYTDSFVDPIEEGVTVNDASYIALGLLIKGRRIRKYLPPFLRLQWPQQTDLIALSQAIPSSGAAAKQHTRDGTMESLKRIKAFLDRPDIEASMRDWSPEDGRVKSLIGFLAMLDRVPFTSSSQNRKIRGIDALTHILLSGSDD